MKNEIKMIEIQQQVRIRKHEIDNVALQKLLRESKSKQKLNNEQIADVLHIPKTKVDHWFRCDKYFAIPDEDIWYELKTILDITTDKYDKAITEFIVQDGVYEKSNRFYDSNGIAPTITCASVNEKIICYEDKNG